MARNEGTTGGTPSAAPQEAPSRYFGQCVNVYRLADGVSRKDLGEAISMRLQQVDAALLAIYGEGLDRFNSMADELQDNYLWMLHSMVGEVSDLWDAMNERKESDIPA